MIIAFWWGQYIYWPDESIYVYLHQVYKTMCLPISKGYICFIIKTLSKVKKNHKGDSLKGMWRNNFKKKIRILNERVTSTLWTGNKQVHVEIGFAKPEVSEVSKQAFYLMLLLICLCMLLVIIIWLKSALFKALLITCLCSVNSVHVDFICRIYLYYYQAQYNH